MEIIPILQAFSQKGKEKKGKPLPNCRTGYLPTMISREADMSGEGMMPRQVFVKASFFRNGLLTVIAVIGPGTESAQAGTQGKVLRQ